MNKTKFSPLEIELAVSSITKRKVISQPRHLDKGFGNENWLVETDKGTIICKIGPKDALLNKWRSVVKAIELVRENDIPTNHLIAFVESCEWLDYRIVRLFDYIEGIPGSTLIESGEDMNRFFYQLGQTVRALHQIKLDFFSSRIDQSESVFKTWKDYVNYRIPQIHKRAETSGIFDIPKLNALWDRVNDALSKINHVITPVLTHRDLHLNNLIASSNGELVAIIDFDAAEAWDPVADFFKLKWRVFNPYPQFFQSFIDGYGKIEEVHPFFKERLNIVEIIELVNIISQDEVDYIKEDSEKLRSILNDYPNPLKE